MTARWPADDDHIRSAAERLRQGAVIAFPTDTLYAVAARARDRNAVARLYAVKRRRGNQPMVWLVSDRAQAEGAALVSSRAAELIDRFWPGPLTLVLPSRDQANGPTLAVRAPGHPVALALLAALGEPVASSSANPAGAAPPVDAEQVMRGLGDDLELVLDGGPSRIGVASTILDLSGPSPRILRQGAIPAHELPSS
ncbi:MAG TPA: L-threonylcarbamoyladenylate synthase [Candidatus Dormibacteraeota bacterium]|nr:L-threonylcarbamoyladenylate synthase [Candidatus Dormibacteraeota bacterium]